jgi:hypothetical protein
MRALEERYDVKLELARLENPLDVIEKIAIETRKIECARELGLVNTNRSRMLSNYENYKHARREKMSLCR